MCHALLLDLSIENMIRYDLSDFKICLTFQKFQKEWNLFIILIRMNFLIIIFLKVQT